MGNKKNDLKQAFDQYIGTEPLVKEEDRSCVAKWLQQRCVSCERCFRRNCVKGLTTFERKLLSAFITVLITVPIITMILSGWERPMEGYMQMIGIVCLYLIPMILLYGLPVTMLSEYVTKKKQGIERSRRALYVHLFFGLSFTFLFVLIFDSRVTTYFFHPIDRFLFICSTLTSFIFWAVDELIRRYEID
ncbi:hypothetical protein ACFSTA_09760 [Ornithinibacillus salinisoli]|uniref:Zinc-finger domain-containing protein n=1 Tax=Ornithinibacillus salinisoli TaxID=1848459 RepID=A0ABW4VYD0_9BACI